MKALTENGEKTGSYFNPEKAQKFEEDTFWNGHNHISKSTGSQWYHENLYLSKSGKWIIAKWSNYEGVPDVHELVDADEAARWFIRNEYEIDNIPEQLKDIVLSSEV